MNFRTAPHPNFSKFLNLVNGYTLLEVLLVLTIGSVLSGLVIVGARSLGGPNALVQASNQVISLIESTQEQAREEGQHMALLLSMDGDEAQRAFAVGNISSGKVEVLRRWQELPHGVMIETTFTTERFPNAFAIEEAIGLESWVEGKGAINCLTFDPYGALSSIDTTSQIIISYSHTSHLEQKGCYLYLRRIQGRPNQQHPLALESDLSELSLLYISPLTGRVSKVSYQ